MSDQSMRVAITGSTGLIGEALRTHLQQAGHTVHRVVRDRAQATGGDVYWSPSKGDLDADALVGVDAVVHLAGEPIGARRWSDEQKARIRDSRVQGTGLLATTLAGLADGPRVLVSGSAVGYYGSRGDELLPESAAPGDDFLAEVTAAWERAAAPAEAAGLRVAYARTGVVLAEDGPLVDKVELPFRLGVGGVIGSGEQYVPWIGLTDEVRALAFLLEHDVSGPANLVAPGPVTNRQLTKAIGEVLGRPTVIPTPTFAIRLLYGEMGVSLATASQRCIPTVLQQAGFEWRQTDVREPLREAFG